jgi:hypothetical protein
MDARAEFVLASPLEREISSGWGSLARDLRMDRVLTWTIDTHDFNVISLR